MIFKCKMCGGTLEFEQGTTVGVCDSCGTKQTLPKLDDDKRANLYDRANHFRRNNEFDKASGIYEQILNEDGTDAEAYWSLVLCRYGIEYVEDPATHKRIPTVNRAQFTSIFDDENYRSALQHADGYQKSIYEEEANAINEIQKGILAVSQREEPFDVFICYKETDQNGRRTPDSVLANDLYHQLTQEGFRVFFARITLEDKLGSAYEPYIFAALNSAKVMVVLGTKPEYFNAVWVKNEWRRYLALVKQSGGQKALIPAYRDMDPYDLPEEFSHLQAQDMSKLGFMQDLIRGIRKLAASKETEGTVREVSAAGTSTAAADAAPILKRAFLALEDGEWQKADAFCEQVLNLEPENAEAYLGKLMVELQCRRRDALKEQAETFDDRNYYQKIIRFADDSLKEELASCIAAINERNENARKDAIYLEAQAEQEKDTVEGLQKAMEIYSTIAGWKDADEQILVCQERGKEIVYFYAQAKEKADTEISLREAIGMYATIAGWKDADERVDVCQSRMEEVKKENEEIDRRKKQKRKRRRKRVAIAMAVCVFLGVIFLNPWTRHYMTGECAYLKGEYSEAVDAFRSIGYKAGLYQSGKKCLSNGDYQMAVWAFYDLGNYKDAKEKLYQSGEKCLSNVNYGYDMYGLNSYWTAIYAFETLGDYKDAKEKLYQIGEICLSDEDYLGALEAFRALGDYKDAKEREEEVCRYIN